MARPNLSEVSGYRGDLFRAGVDQVRQASLDLDDLNISEGTGDPLYRFIAATLIPFLTSPDLMGADLSPVVRAQIRESIVGVVEGSLQASEAIHYPSTTKEEVDQVLAQDGDYGSPSDYQTDAKGLRVLPLFFK